MTLHYRNLPDITGVAWGYTSDSVGVKIVEFPDAHLSDISSAAAVQPDRHGSAFGYAKFGKRILDIVLGSIALFLAAPVLLVLALALWIESGNPFYRQRRVGRGGNVFNMWKLRTMVLNAEDNLQACLDANPALKTEWEETQKLKKDPRITPLGRLLRQTSMDELPQIFNVLRGDMSLVGPRPMLPEQMPLYLHAADYMAVQPGITGLWQVTARNEDSFVKRAALDARYVHRLSFWLDLKIIMATFGVIFRATGY